MGDDVDLRLLRLLVDINETGSLTAAARRQQITQSNASRDLARWERRLGVSLVTRSPRGSVLSEAGTVVASWSQPVLDAVADLGRAVAALREDRAAHLCVGASQTVAEYLAPHWLAGYRTAHSDVHARLRVANSTEVVAALRAGDVDVGFIESPMDVGDLHSQVVLRDRLCVVVAPKHPWARRDSITVGDLAATSLVVREEESGTRMSLEHQLHPRRLAPPALVVSANAAVLGSVAAGVAPAVLSELVVGASTSVCTVAVRDAELTRQIRAIWAPPLSRPARDFLTTALKTPRPGRRS